MTYASGWGGIWWDEDTGETVYEYSDETGWPLDVATSERAEGVMVWT